MANDTNAPVADQVGASLEIAYAATDVAVEALNLLQAMHDAPRLDRAQRRAVQDAVTLGFERVGTIRAVLDKVRARA